MNDTRVERIALVTGAAAGMGRAVVAVFSAHGWEVLALDNNEDALHEAWHNTPGVTTHAVDISLAGITDDVLHTTGHRALGACVNAAGIYPPSTFLDFEEADYRRVFDVNVLGTVLTSHAASRLLCRSPGSTIVNFASTGAYAPGDGRRVMYKASKAAVVSLTRSMAYELAPLRVRVIGLAPGPVQTEGSVAGGDIRELAETVPMGRPATADELAAWVWALAGDDALPFITGETIVVSGGALMR